MKTYIISEVAYYKVKANSEEEAEEKFLDAEDINKFFDHVEDREVYEEQTYVKLPNTWPTLRPTPFDANA